MDERTKIRHSFKKNSRCDGLKISDDSGLMVEGRIVSVFTLWRHKAASSNRSLERGFFQKYFKIRQERVKK